jgi:cytochrome P450
MFEFTRRGPSSAITTSTRYPPGVTSWPNLARDRATVATRNVSRSSRADSHAEVNESSAVLQPRVGALEHHGQHVDFDSLKDMTLLDNVVREALRLHPPLIMLIRKVVTDFDYGRYRVPAGSFAVTSPPVSHANPEIFPQPNDFTPNRYRPERAEDENPFAYVPFGGGHHRCSGMRFGLLQVKAILSILLQRYEMVLVEPNPEPDFSGMVVVPKRPCRIRYRRRSATTDAT